MAKPKTVARTISVGIGANPRFRRQRFAAKVLSASITAVGVATVKLLRRLQDCMAAHEDSQGRLLHVDLLIPFPPDKLAQAQAAVAITPERQAKIADRRAKLAHKGAKEQARPMYPTAYRAMEIIEQAGFYFLRCRVAEAFGWRSAGGKTKGQWCTDVDKIDATIGLQGLLKSWVPIDWNEVPSVLRAGACQQAAQQFNSNIGLIAKDMKASYPSLAERDPARRQAVWQAAINRVILGTHPLEQKLAREVHPGKYAADDPRGDRLVVTDSDWLSFVQSPFPQRQALNFVKSTDTPVYTCATDEGLYIALPLFDGVAATSPLGQLSREPEAVWWHTRIDEFTPLPLWPSRHLTCRKKLLLVPLQTRKPDRVIELLSGQDGRKVNWSLLTETRGTRGRRRNKVWFMPHVATSRQVEPHLRPNVLGIHFGTEPILWWTVRRGHDGQVIERGHIGQNEILTAGLAGQLKLVERQGEQRWVGQRKFSGELKRRTDDAARIIVELAAAHDANLTLEKIAWVEKRRGGRQANRRFSMWNYAQLPKRTEWMGLERQIDRQPAPVVTVTRVSDYLLRYTCPKCSACRRAKQTRDNATTWREGDILHCRQCSYEGTVPDEHQADLVSAEGVAAYHKLSANS